MISKAEIQIIRRVLKKHGYGVTKQAFIVKLVEPEDKIKNRRIINDNYWMINERKNSDLSVGEKLISDYLTTNSIQFNREHYFHGLYNPETEKPLFVDFYIPSFNLVIEFDGEFHFRSSAPDLEECEKIKRNDRHKNRFLKSKKINFIRIPYWERKKERIEHLIAIKLDKILGHSFYVHNFF